MEALSQNPTRALEARSYAHRELVMLSFCEQLPPGIKQLRHFNGKQWRELLFWMDTSGLALYFLDVLKEANRSDILPPQILARLESNLTDNTARTNAMIAEAAAIHRAFQSANISYATLKGFSLWPTSVPKVELRSQLDLDFLIAEADAPKARLLLESQGYHLQAISGRSWEFKALGSAVRSLKDLYKAIPKRCVELHLESSDAGLASLLARIEICAFHGVNMPVLSAVDLFLGQGMHLYKHVSSGSFRNAHLIEFRRHILARYNDDAFWSELRKIADGRPSTSLGLGLVILLISRLMGSFAPQPLTCWTVDSLPPSVSLWIQMYGPKAVYRGFPGNKLYLLLQAEMQKAGQSSKRSRGRILLPRALPPAIEQRPPNEPFVSRIGRYFRQARFILFRLRFHLVEGLRYLYESIRWQREIRKLAL